MKVVENICLLVLFLLFPFGLSAQLKVAQQLMWEIDEQHGSQYQLYPLDNKGTLSILESKDYLRGGKKTLLLTFLDTSLAPIWEAKPSIEYEHKLLYATHDESNVYILIQQKSTSYEFLAIDIVSGYSQVFEIEDVIPIEVSLFKVHRKILFLGGEIDNRPAVVSYNYSKEKSLKVLPQINLLKASLKDLSFSEDGEVVSVITKNQRNKYPQTFIYNFTIDGRLINKIPFPDSEDYSLLSFRLWVLNESEQWVFGTYAHTHHDLAQGFYAFSFVDGEIKTTKRHDFAELPNFFNYMDTKKEKLIEKAKEKQAKGKTKVWDLHLWVNDLSLHGNKIVLSGEVYHPITPNNTISTPNSINYNYRAFNVPLRMRRQVFSSLQTANIKNSGSITYQYKAAFAVIFDRRGQLVWENTLAYDNDMQLHTLSNQTHFVPQTDSLVAVYCQEDMIKGKALYRDKVVKAESLQGIDTLITKNVVVEAWQQQLYSWYNQYFLLAGCQQQRTYDSQKGRTNKDIFFISKLYWRPENPIQQEQKEK